MTTVNIPGSPGGLDALAGQLESAANDIDSVRDRVATNGLEGEWSGQAADAFRSTLHHLPGELATVGGAFGDATGTIRSFAGRLAELQQQARWYDEKLQQAEQDLREANARHEAATESLHSASRQQAVAHDPVSLSRAKQAVARGESMVRQTVADVEEVEGSISQLNNGAQSIGQEYEEAVRSCRSALEAALPPGESMWSGLRHGFDDITGGAVRLGGDICHGADRGIHDAEKDIDHSFVAKEFDYFWAGARRVIVDTTEVVSDATLVIAGAAIAAGVAITVGTGGVGFLADVPLGAVAAVALTANEWVSKVGYGIAAGGDTFAEATSQTKAEKDEYRKITPEDDVNLAASFMPGGKKDEVAVKRLAKDFRGWAISDVAQRGLHGVEDLESQPALISPPLAAPSVFRIALPSSEPAVA